MTVGLSGPIGCQAFDVGPQKDGSPGAGVRRATVHRGDKRFDLPAGEGRPGHAKPFARLIGQAVGPAKPFDFRRHDAPSFAATPGVQQSGGDPFPQDCFFEGTMQ